MEKKDISATKPASVAAAPAAPVVTVTPAVKQEATGKSKLYVVSSPIKHDGEDYEAGDEIRLPEATAHRLAGYLKA